MCLLVGRFRPGNRELRGGLCGLDAGGHPLQRWARLHETVRDLRDRKDLLRARAVLRNYLRELESDPSLGKPDDAKALLVQIDELLGAAPTDLARRQGGSERRMDGLKIGLGTVGALAEVSLVVGMATAATIARQPFQGRRYRAIYRCTISIAAAGPELEQSPRAPPQV